MARGLDPYSFMAMANGLVRDLEGTQLEIWWQEGLKKRYLDRPLQMGSVVKIFVSRVNAHQREISTQCDLNNWVDKMIHSMYVHGLINKATWQHGWRFCVVPVTWTHQGQFGYGHCWIPNLPINTELPIWYHSLRRPAKHLVAGLLHWITFILEAHFFPTGVGRYSAYQFVFPAHIAIYGLTEYLIYCHGISHSIASD